MILPGVMIYPQKLKEINSVRSVSILTFIGYKKHLLGLYRRNLFV